MALINSGRSIAAVLCLILFILIFVFFGIRWFRGTQSMFTYTGSWPPIINMCPDYLVYYKNSKSSTLNFTDSCVDLLGIGSSQLSPWTSDETPSNPPANVNKYFPYVFKPGMTQAQLQELCAMAQRYGLTWEGIYNGESCIATTGVAVPGDTTSSGTKCPGGASPCAPGQASC
jgi:hypothetical protein